MAISSVRKGREAEAEYKKIMEAKGYDCFKPTKAGRYSKQQDIFGVFDIICVNTEELLLVQVKLHYKKDMAKLRAFTNHPSAIKKILAVKIFRKGWEEYVIE